MKGKVLRFISERGYGFIHGDDGNEYFFHISKVPYTQRSLIRKGQDVEFLGGADDRGLNAKRVKIYELVSFSTEKKVHKLKANPFTPQAPIADPRKFAGRNISVINAIDSLFNGKNVLVSGQRGVGKSSLSIQLLNVLRGDESLLKKLNFETGEFKFNYLVSDHRCTENNTIEEISVSLVNGLSSNLGIKEKSEDVSSEWQLNLKVLRLKEKAKNSPIVYTDISSQFASDLINLYSMATAKGFNGMCMLIDEVDVLEDRVLIAPFLKATLEKLQQEGINNICFLVAGVTGIATRLIGEHKSSMRLFEACPLEPMSNGDIAELLKITLEGSGTIINQDATSLITEKSNCFPQPAQLLGYHSFKINDDEVIDSDDVNDAENFIVRSIREPEFRRLINEVSVNEAAVLRAASTTCQITFNIRYILMRSDLSEVDVVAAIGKLIQSGILEISANETYAFVDPFFSSFVKWNSGNV